MSHEIFQGCIPALMTPCDANGSPDFDALAANATRLMALGMSAVVYCGSMGEWPLLGDRPRREGVSRLVEEGIPVIVGTGAQNPVAAAGHAAHARDVGAGGLMVIPRVLSRGTSVDAQRHHFAGILHAAGDLPAIIYNSPYYGFETKADLFFELRSRFSNLVGYKEFGGAEALTYAAEHITSADNDLCLVVGVDTQVVHGIVNCGATGVISGIGNVLPEQVLHLVGLSRAAAAGDATAQPLAFELDTAMRPLSEFDKGPDLVLYFKYLSELRGASAYGGSLHRADVLTAAQRGYAATRLRLFELWWADWEGASYQT